MGILLLRVAESFVIVADPFQEAINDRPIIGKCIVYKKIYRNLGAMLIKIMKQNNSIHEFCFTDTYDYTIKHLNENMRATTKK